MRTNERRSAHWLQTFAQIMEVDRQRPLRTRSAPKPSLPAGNPLGRRKEEEKA